MIRNVMAGWTAAVLLLASAGSLLAHHTLAQFDTTTAVRVEGVLVRFEQVNPHSLLFIDQTGRDGKVQRWAVEGPGVLQLKRLGLDLAKFKVGDTIEACGYVTKEGVEWQRTVYAEPVLSRPTETSPKITLTGKLMDGELVVMPDGKRLKWSDYGHHLCLNPGFTDFHSK